MRRIVGVLALSAALVAACGPGAAAPPTSTSAQGTPSAATTTAKSGGALALGERRNDGGGVEMVAEWSSPEPLSLTVTLDTHSVDLDRFDLRTVAKLRLDGGEWTAPTAADVPKGGHHRAGTLTFGSVAPAAFASARVIELRVVEVWIPERLLRWERG